MCLIYYRNPATHSAAVNLDVLCDAHAMNPDGVGLAWYGKGKWQTWREVRPTWRSVRRRLERLELDGLRFAVHFRYATQGAVTIDNCHPFKVAPETLLFHNGTFRHVRTHGDESDTAAVARTVRALIAGGSKPTTVLDVLRLVEGQRLLLTLPGGRVRLSGDWVSEADGCYSNSNCHWFAPPKKRKRKDANKDNGKYLGGWPDDDDFDAQYRRWIAEERPF